MFVSLPMYDLPERADATDAWWRGLRRHFAAQGLREIPEQLSRPKSLFLHWRDDQPVFSQTCGYPLTHMLTGQLQLVATPRYASPGCAGASYVSWIVVRRGDPARTLEGLRGRVIAFNSSDSQSGYNAPRALIAPLAAGNRFFSAAIVSGAHRHSMAMVRDGTADAAAIDCVSFALIAQVAPEEVADLRVLIATPAAPGLPYVTATATSASDIAKLREGLRLACADPDLAFCRAALLIDGFEILPLSAYEVIQRQQLAADAAQYPVLQ